MVQSSTNEGKKGREVERLGLKELPVDGWGKTPHWVFQGTLAMVVGKYGRGAGLIWLALSHAIEGHHVDRARVSIRELAWATGLSRTGVERALRRMRAGGEVRVIQSDPGMTFVYDMRQRQLRGGEEVSQ